MIYYTLLTKNDNHPPLPRSGLFCYNKRKPTHTSRTQMHSDSNLTARKNNHAKVLEEKAAAKAALQEELGWPEEARAALVCLPAGMTEQLGGKLLEDLIPGLLSLPIQLVILGKGSANYGTLFTDLAKKHSHRVAIVPNKKDVIDAVMAASDMALFLASTEGMSEVHDCLAHGVVPIAPEDSNLQNYNPNQESGTAFTYEDPTVWNAFGALVRALETFKFPFDWKTIQKQCMESAE